MILRQMPVGTRISARRLWKDLPKDVARDKSHVAPSASYVARDQVALVRARDKWHFDHRLDRMAALLVVRAWEPAPSCGPEVSQDQSIMAVTRGVYARQTPCTHRSTEVHVKSILSAAVVVLLLGGTMAEGTPGQGRGNKHAKGASASDQAGVSEASVGVHVVFGTGDVRVLREHYTPRYRNLPPGLQKKVARGRPLPPGWQKKFEPFPAAIERQLGPLPRGYSRGVIDGHAVIYNSRTSLIVDLAVLF